MNRQWDEGPMLRHSSAAPIDRFDPRLRTLAVGLTALGTVAAGRLLTLLGLLALGLFFLALARMPLAVTVKRCLPLLGFGVLLAMILPWTVPGTPLGTGFWAHASWEGLTQAGLITLRALIIILATIGLVGTLEIPVLGHAFVHLRIPPKLVFVFLYAVRYLQVLQDEYHRLRTAMVTRGFRPAMNRHTYRAYGYLVGMLLVRSLERSERILTAMRCRGFRGKFYVLDHFHFTSWDILFGLICAIATGLYFGWEVVW